MKKSKLQQMEVKDYSQCMFGVVFKNQGFIAWERAPKGVNSYYKIGGALNHIVQGRVAIVWGLI